MGDRIDAVKARNVESAKRAHGVALDIVKAELGIPPGVSIEKGVRDLANAADGAGGPPQSKLEAAGRQAVKQSK